MNKSIPDFNITIGERRLDRDLKSRITSLDYIENIDDTGKFDFTITFDDDFPIGPDELKFGTQITLEIGYQGNMVPIFFGNINRVKPIWKTGNYASLNIVSYDVSQYMKKTNAWRTFVNPTPYRLIKALQSKYNDIEMVIEIDELKKDFKLLDDQSLVQINKTDWEVFDSVAMLHNYRLFVYDNKVHIVNDDWIRENLQNKHYLLSYNRNPHEINNKGDYDDILDLIDFEAEAGADDQKESVEVLLWKVLGNAGRSRNQIFAGAGPDLNTYTEMIVNIDGRRERLKIFGHAAQNDAQAKLLAEGELKRRADRLVSGEGKILGNPYFRMGQKHDILIRRQGKYGLTYSGEYFIKSTSHGISISDGYITTFEVTRDQLTAID